VSTTLKIFLNSSSPNGHLPPWPLSLRPTSIASSQISTLTFSSSHSARRPLASLPLPIPVASQPSPLPALQFEEIIGAGVEKPFDKSTLLAAAKAVSEKFRTSCDVAKVENRLKSFKTKWTKVHPKDATLLNRPIKNYNELAILFTDDINTEEIGTKEETVGGHCERQPPTSTPGSSSAPSSRGRSSRFTRHEEANVVDVKNLVVKIGELIDAIKDLKPRDFGEELWNAISACDYNERMSVVAFEYFLKNEIEGKVFLVRHPEMRREWLAKFFSSLL
ncbi:hypothetical protein ACMD2_10397, partial [Ananas comosus]